GRVFVWPGFVDVQTTDKLREYVLQLEAGGNFAPSGLSNKGKGDQNFGKRDRLVCPVSVGMLGGGGGGGSGGVEVGEEMGSVGSVEEGEGIGGVGGAVGVGMDTGVGDVFCPSMAQALGRVALLRHELSHPLSLHRPLTDSLPHEAYCSLSLPGALLRRHLDERHEELKGRRGWTSPSRRSFSWLLYLHQDWTPEKGGLLRTFPPVGRVVRGPPGANMDDLQSRTDFALHDPSTGVTDADFEKHVDFSRVPGLASLLSESKSQFESTSKSQSWVRFLSIERMALVPEEEGIGNIGSSSSSSGSTHSKTPEGCACVDIPPLGGTLVIFDSVCLPHEVRETLVGKRPALAGWMHETTQSFPDWL
ncbi:hypothetical protein B484DRAFT_402438, partial [Ochromonadaceae sp. CCMP2298]